MQCAVVCLAGKSAHISAAFDIAFDYRDIRYIARGHIAGKYCRIAAAGNGAGLQREVGNRCILESGEQAAEVRCGVFDIEILNGETAAVKVGHSCAVTSYRLPFDSIEVDVIHELVPRVAVDVLQVICGINLIGIFLRSAAGIADRSHYAVTREFVVCLDPCSDTFAGFHRIGSHRPRIILTLGRIGLSGIFHKYTSAGHTLAYNDEAARYRFRLD